MYCGQCGAEISTSARFCQNCGAKVENLAREKILIPKRPRKSGQAKL